MTNLIEAAERIQKFSQGSLGTQIASIEECIKHKNREESLSLTTSLEINSDLLDSALILKKVAGQIHDIVHASGILILLPHILKDGEVIEYLSLAAGNSGRVFDMETNLQIAEFKFSQWKGGSDTIRQNALFKDFYQLAEYETERKRFLYVVEPHYQLKFLESGREIKSVFSRNVKLLTNFQRKYGNEIITVSDYFNYWPKNWVQIEDIATIIPNFLVMSSMTTSLTADS